MTSIKRRAADASGNGDRPVLDAVADDICARAATETIDMKNPVNPVERIHLVDISVEGIGRSVNAESVRTIAESMSTIGQTTPIHVRRVADRVVLVAGRHRLEAAKQLGWHSIDAIMMQGDGIDARLWTIAENLHRADLTLLERAEQEAEWVRLVDEKKQVSGQNVQKRRAGRPEGGIAKAARELPVKGKTPEAKRKSIERSLKIDRISPEAKSSARTGGLDDKLSALLAVAKEETPEAQVKKVGELVDKKKAGSTHRRHRAASTQPVDGVPELPEGFHAGIRVSKELQGDRLEEFDEALRRLATEFNAQVIWGRQSLQPGLGATPEESEPTDTEEATAEEEAADEKPRDERGRRVEPRRVTVEEAIDEAFSEFGQLEEEMQSWGETMPENLQSSYKYEQVTEAAGALGEIAGDVPNVDESLAGLTIAIEDPPPRQRRYSRADRCTQAINILDSVIGKLEEVGGDAAVALVDQLRSTRDAATEIDFPGMYG